jgi:hypothetical protein
MKYTVILQRESDGGYVATVLARLVASRKATLAQKFSRTLQRLSSCTWKISAKKANQFLSRPTASTSRSRLSYHDENAERSLRGGLIPRPK